MGCNNKDKDIKYYVFFFYEVLSHFVVYVPKCFNFFFSHRNRINFITELDTNYCTGCSISFVQ